MNLAWRRWRDRFMVLLIVLGAMVALLPLFLVLSHALIEGFSSLNWAFFTQPMKPPGELGGGLSQAIIGTLIVDGIGLLLALPVGLAAGILLSEYPEHKLNPLVRLMADTLNGMPAILKGLLAFILIVRPSGHFSAVAGAVALAFLMIPIITKATEGVLKLVPWELREAGLALGLPRWRVVLWLVLPTAKAGVLTGVLLALARAAGEAAPLLFTSFGNNFVSLDPWKAIDTLPLRLFSYAISPYEDWHRQAWAAGLVLILLIVITSALARWSIKERK